MDKGTMFNLNSALVTNALRAEFERCGRVSIAPFLDDNSVAALHQNLRRRTDWSEILNNGNRLIELNRDAQQQLTEEQRANLSNAIYAQAREGFQYRYETIRVPDNHEARLAMNDMLAEFALWMSGGAVLDFLRSVTGFSDIDFADAQATAYSPGHFLTGHDDDFVGKNRLLAYVLGLTPTWRTEWGGLLLFHESDNRLSGFVPDFNRLNLFSVPQMHSVSEVARSSPYRRYAVTGWLRRGSCA